MDHRFLKFAEQTAPRYTSYPTAPHFHGGVDAEIFRSWLGVLAPDASVSLYLHMPYCRQMCWYCGCHAFAARRDEPVAEYVEAVLREIDLAADAMTAKGVREIHWGGGTPNVLSPERFEAIASRIAARFDTAECNRHAVEIDPRLISAGHARAFARCGVDRASLGVQDLDPKVQHAIGRIQPFEQVAAAAAVLRAEGIDRLNFDLMYGLPHRSIDSVRETAARAASLEPARLSVFGYAHVPWFKARQRLMDESGLPDAALRYDLAEAIGETLDGAGYVAIGYDHYAKPDDAIALAASARALTRSFQGFVEAQCDALVGLGPSAISTLPQGYAQNDPQIGQWRAAVGAGRLATVRGRALTTDDRVRRDLIMALLCDFEIAVEAVAALPGVSAEMAALEREGLVQCDGSSYRIPRPARAFARIVAQTLDAYRDLGAARHSRAV